MASKQFSPCEHDLRKVRDSFLIAELHRKMRDPRLRHLSFNQLILAAAESPAPSFFVTYDYAIRVWNRYAKGRLQLGRSLSDAKWAEIIRRVSLLVKNYGIYPRDAVARVIGQQAPCYYLKPDSAVRAFRRMRHRRRPAE